MKEDYTDAACHGMHTPTNVEANDRTNRLLRDRIDELCYGLTDFSADKLAVGISVISRPYTRQFSRTLQKIANQGIELEANQVFGVDQPQVNHDLCRMVAHGHIDPIAAIGC